MAGFELDVCVLWFCSLPTTLIVQFRLGVFVFIWKETLKIELTNLQTLWDLNQPPPELKHSPHTLSYSETGWVLETESKSLVRHSRLVQQFEPTTLHPELPGLLLGCDISHYCCLCFDRNLENGVVNKSETFKISTWTHNVQITETTPYHPELRGQTICSSFSLFCLYPLKLKKLRLEPTRSWTIV